MNAGEALLRAIASSAGQQEEEQNTYVNCTLDADVLTERLVEALNERNEARHKPKFKVGDFVTPLQQHGIRGYGDPHIVLDVIPNAQPLFDPQRPTHKDSGAFLDMRIGVFVDNDTMFCFWCESWQYQDWSPEMRKR
jgi:hypothetical protein